MGLLDNVGRFFKDAGDGIAHAAGNGSKAASDAWNAAFEDAKASANVVGTAVRDADAKKEQLGAWIDSKEQQLQPTGSSSLPQVTPQETEDKMESSTGGERVGRRAEQATRAG